MRGRLRPPPFLCDGYLSTMLALSYHYNVI